MSVRIVLSGDVGIEPGEGPEGGVGLGSVARLALAYLAWERHRPIPRDELADVLWGEQLPASWEQMVRGVVSTLRRALGAAGLPAQSVLTTSVGGYQLHLPDDVLVDVEEAARHLQAAREMLAAGDPGRAHRHAEEAVAVAARQFLPRARGPWVERRQAELEELHVRALETLAEAAEAQGEWAEAIAAAERAISLDPLRESAYVRLMAAHAGAGNRGQALRGYERCRQALADELGVDPSAPTQAAFLALLRDEPDEAALPETAAPMPLPPALRAVPGSFLVGRAGEGDRLASASKRSRTEGRQAVLVGGEPGIGKSALVAEFARGAYEEGARVLYGRCEEELGVAYQPFAEALGHHVARCPLPELAAHVAAHGGELARLTPELARRLPDIPPPPVTDPEADRYRLFEAVDALLRSAARSAPVLLVLDDLHWAAAPTLLLLRHLLRQGPPVALLVVGTYRHTEVGAGHPLTFTLADLRREPGVDRVVLAGLDEDGVVAFMQEAEGHRLGAEGMSLARAVHVHTSGNPFFVGELLRHLAETGAVYRREGTWSYYADGEGFGVPAGVAEVVTRRLGRLSNAARGALVPASVIGAEFDFDLLERLTEGPDDDALLDALDQAVGSDLVAEVGIGRYRFAHALVRETIYSGLTGTRRARLHRQVGEALESHPGRDDLRLPALAHHFAAAGAGCASKAADYALAAARLSLGKAAWEDAVTHLERGLQALDAQEPSDLQRRCDLLLLLAETWTRFFDPSRALVAAKPAVEAAWALGEPERMGQAAFWYVRSAGRDRSGDPSAEISAAARFAREALAVLGDAHLDLSAKLLARLSGLAAQAGVGRDDQAMGREALELARQSGNPDALGVALGHSCAALRGSPRVEEHLALAEELVSAAPPGGWDGWRDGHHQRALARLASGDRAGFEADVAACERLGVQRRFWWFQWVAGFWKAALALLDGRFREVEPLADHARHLDPLEQQFGEEFFWRQLFILRRELGDLVGAGAAADQLQAHWPRNQVNRSMILGIRAQLHGAEQQRDELEHFADHGPGPTPLERIPLTLAYRTEVAMLLGGSERARSLYETVLPWRGQMIGGGMGEGCHGAVDRYLGMLASQGGRWQEAQSHFEAALTFEESMKSPPLVARTRYWYAHMLLARAAPGDHVAAGAFLRASLETAEQLGMAGLAADALALLSEE